MNLARLGPPNGVPQEGVGEVGQLKLFRTRADYSAVVVLVV